MTNVFQSKTKKCDATSEVVETAGLTLDASSQVHEITLRGKVVLVEKEALLCGSTSRETMSD